MVEGQRSLCEAWLIALPACLRDQMGLLRASGYAPPISGRHAACRFLSVSNFLALNLGRKSTEFACQKVCLEAVHPRRKNFKEPTDAALVDCVRKNCDGLIKTDSPIGC